VAILRTLPDAVLTAAIDEPSMLAALEFMRTWEGGLTAVRYPRDDVSDRFNEQECPAFELGKARLLTPRFADLDAQRPDVAILAFGTPAVAAAEAIEALGSDYRVALWDARFAKPVDVALVRALLSRDIPVLTLEDHSVVGGFGAAVVEAAQEMRLNTARVVRHGIPDHWIFQNSRKLQLAEVGLDAEGIARMIRHAADPDRNQPFVARATESAPARPAAAVKG
jgi:1-deoxy-D-xylulose-5-phosphate synthase